MGAIFILVKMCLALVVLSWYGAGVLKMINQYFYSEFSKQLKKEFPKNGHLGGIMGTDQCPAERDQRRDAAPTPPAFPQPNIHHPSWTPELSSSSSSKLPSSSHDQLLRAKGLKILKEDRKIVEERGGEYLFKPSQVNSVEIDESVRERTSSPSYLSTIKAHAAGTMTTTASTSIGQQPPPSSSTKMDQEFGQEEEEKKKKEEEVVVVGAPLGMEPQRIGEKASMEGNKDMGERHDYAITQSSMSVDNLEPQQLPSQQFPHNWKQKPEPLSHHDFQLEPSLEHQQKENQLFTSPYFQDDSCPARNPHYQHQPNYLLSSTEQSCQQKD